jgi:hypothetical protein
VGDDLCGAAVAALDCVCEPDEKRFGMEHELIDEVQDELVAKLAELSEDGLVDRDRVDRDRVDGGAHRRSPALTTAWGGTFRRTW